LDVHEDVQVRLICWKVGSENDVRFFVMEDGYIEKKLQGGIVTSEDHQMARMLVRNIFSDEGFNGSAGLIGESGQSNSGKEFGGNF
jgi:hypothetical protein